MALPWPERLIREGQRRRCVPTSSAEPSVADPRVEEHVREVDHQVDQYVDEGEEQDHALDGWEVARQHRIDRQPAEPRDGVYRLGDHHAADQDGDADADYGG